MLGHRITPLFLERTKEGSCPPASPHGVDHKSNQFPALMPAGCSNRPYWAERGGSRFRPAFRNHFDDRSPTGEYLPMPTASLVSTVTYTAALAARVIVVRSADGLFSAIRTVRDRRPSTENLALPPAIPADWVEQKSRATQPTDRYEVS